MIKVDVVAIREVLIVVLVEVELSSLLDVVVASAAVNGSALFVVVAFVCVSVSTLVLDVVSDVVLDVDVVLALVLAPDFGTAVHLFPSMLVMKAPAARDDAMLTPPLSNPCCCPYPLLLGDSSRFRQRRVTEGK